MKKLILLLSLSLIPQSFATSESFIPSTPGSKEKVEDSNLCGDLLDDSNSSFSKESGDAPTGY
ncbi:MAG: hypothetical protein H0T84_01435 [Tatlockia sp.]|nr:hypothetical protein [Tatlockia sp.]